MSFHSLDIDERDLAEAPRISKNEQSRGMVIGLVVGAILFLALLVYGSLPELSPEEIVAMDGYEGEQPTRHIFNMQSMQDKDEDATAPPAPVVTSATMTAPVTAAEPRNNELPIAVTEPVPVINESTSIAIVVQEPEEVEELPIAQTEDIPQQEVVVESTEVEPDVVKPVTVQVDKPEPIVVEPTELPIVVTEPVPAPVVVAVTAPQESNIISFGTSTQEREFAAKPTTPTIDEASDTVVVSSVVAPVPLPASSSISSPAANASEDRRGRLLPLRSIVEDVTELKVSPSVGSRTLLSLKRGNVVTAFERRGRWVQVGVNDGSSVTGFVLETSLSKVETKKPG